MTTLTHDLIEKPFGPDYRVQNATEWFGSESKGWVVEHIPTGKCVWTGGYMSISKAFELLWLHIRREDARFG